jgi:hypothetical protein
MANLFECFDDPFIYGPLTEKEVTELTVNHRLITLNGGFYIGVSKEQNHLSDRYIARPSVE